ncbi:MAG: nucleoside-triphosphatase [Nanoarchaeota archaeon]
MTKLFITGKPHSGKTTILERVLDRIPRKCGFITREIPGDTHRLGFEVIGSDGSHWTFAHVDFSKQHKVSRYGVDVEGFGKWVSRFQHYSPNDILYIDEIGQMELHSHRFRQLAESYLQADNSFIATLSSVYQDPLLEQIRSDPQAHIITVTDETREQAYRECARILQLQ